MSRLLEDQTAIITGAASGIGLEIASRMAAEGAHVVVSDIRADLAMKAAKSIKHNHGVAVSFQADMRSEAQIKALVAFTAKKFKHVDILVNNAGIQYVSPIEQYPVDKFNELIQLMLVGPFISIKHVFPLMKKRKYGRIINIASINGLIGFAGKAAYNSAKHGLIGLTKVAALEGADYGITVNALCPGYANTSLVLNQMKDLARTRHVAVEKVLEEIIYPLVPQHRLLEPSEIADYAVFLASDKARGVTGQAVVIDGGYLAQ